MNAPQQFVQSYIECMLWSSIGDDGEPLDDDCSISDLSPEAIERIISDCTDFLADPRTMELCQKYGMERCGHDFWLTRNRHGAGFWDRGYGEPGDYLTDRAHVYGSCEPYVGEDGVIYLA